MYMHDYWEQNSKIGKFGIKYLDDVLVGISRSDLILIGARSGAGKTTVANRIFNVNNNETKCKLFSLENFMGDLFSNNVYVQYLKLTYKQITPREWQMGEFEKDEELLKKAEDIVKENLHEEDIISRKDEFGLTQLKEEMIKACEKGYKLLILDHLEYVDKNNPDENDLKHTTLLMKEIRRLQDIYRVGVVAISHLRKMENTLKTKVIIPNENEFIGSSNKVKESTVVIMFAPDDEGNMKINEKHLRKTWCCIRKNRYGGVDGKCANLIYDTRTQNYADDYDVYKINYTGTKVEFLEHKGTIELDESEVL